MDVSTTRVPCAPGKRATGVFTVEVLLQNLLGVILRFGRGVGVVDGGLVAADDMSVRHCGGLRLMC